MMVKLFYKPIALLVSVLGGMLAGAIFKQVWKAAAHEDEAPKATEAGRGWREILIAAGLQGAIWIWPGEQSRAAADEARS